MVKFETLPGTAGKSADPSSVAASHASRRSVSSLIVSGGPSSSRNPYFFPQEFYTRGITWEIPRDVLISTNSLHAHSCLRILSSPQTDSPVGLLLPSWPCTLCRSLAKSPNFLPDKTPALLSPSAKARSFGINPRMRTTFSTAVSNACMFLEILSTPLSVT